MKGVKKSQRKVSFRCPSGRRSFSPAETNRGAGMPRSFQSRSQSERHEHRDDAIPEENKQQQTKCLANGSMGCANDSAMAIALEPVPAGGLLASTSVSTVVPEVRSDSRCERLQVRQKAMSLATLMSSLGMTPLHCGHVGVTDSAETTLSSHCLSTNLILSSNCIMGGPEIRPNSTVRLPRNSDFLCQYFRAGMTQAAWIFSSERSKMATCQRDCLGFLF